MYQKQKNVTPELILQKTVITKRKRVIICKTDTDDTPRINDVKL